ncbi:MAG: transposase [Candidatus Aminicenantales bacterium]
MAIGSIFTPHLHFLVTEGGVDKAGAFHKISRIDDSRLAELFAREVLGFLVHKELLSPEWADRLLSWRHTGFNVHSRVRAKIKRKAERVGKYMVRPLLSLERLSLDEQEGKLSKRGSPDRQSQKRNSYPSVFDFKDSLHSIRGSTPSDALLFFYT